MQCAACGFVNLENARFCSGCGAPLIPTPDAETRKTVTVLFADVTGSTELGERNDPETMRSVMGSYFAEMRAVLERHGGTVEKFIGDAVMAVFGVPTVHEDDAARACRAAWEMTAALDRLNADLDRDFGLRLRARIGVNTGEVVVGQGSRETLATGDAVNVAARLQQAADPGQILLGDPTYRLARNVVEATAVGDLTVKGKSNAVSAWRMTGCLDIAAPMRTAPRELIGPLVGRDRELALLEQLFERCAAERTCQLVTLLGVAGIGKSRLLREFTAGLDDRAKVVAGRCLSYGDGVALWPLLEALRAYLGDPASDALGRARLEQLVADDPDAAQLVERLSAVAGLHGTPASLSDVQWAVRRWLELGAQTKPIVLVIDDLHWADVALLDVLEHVVDWTRNAPVLLICLARPEFLDEHTHWSGGKLNTTNLLLQPLPEEASNRLLDQLLGPETAAAVRSHVQRAAGGNPLFLEQLLAMLADEGTLLHADGRWQLQREVTEIVLPPSIGTLLAARLDRLPAAERANLEAAAVIGQLFYAGAVRELSSDDAASVPDVLRALARKQLIRPDRSDVAGEEAYRFEHVLVRDAAYAAVPKRRRAGLHEKFARWLNKRADAMATSDVDEFVGYHLEQAVVLQRDVSPAIAASTEPLAEEAVERLIRASEQAYWTDEAAAATLLDRAAALLPLTRRQLDLRLKATRLIERDHPHVIARAIDIRIAAEAIGLDDLALQARLHETNARLLSDPVAISDEALTLATAAAERFKAEGNEVALMTAYDSIISVVHLRGQWKEVTQGLKSVLAIAQRIGDLPTVHYRTGFLGGAMVWGPTPATEGLALLGDTPDPAAPRWLQGLWHWYSAVFHAYQDRPDRARGHAATARELASQLHVNRLDMSAGFFAGTTARALSNDGEFEDVMQASARALEAAEDVASLSTLLPVLGRLRLQEGNLDEALRIASRARDMTNEADPMSQCAWRSLEARVRAGRGETARPRELFDEAVEWIHRSDQTNEQADVHEMYAEVAELLGDDALARRELEAARDLYLAKENIASARRVQARLAR